MKPDLPWGSNVKAVELHWMWNVAHLFAWGRKNLKAVSFLEPRAQDQYDKKQLYTTGRKANKVLLLKRKLLLTRHMLSRFYFQRTISPHLVARGVVELWVQVISNQYLPQPWYVCFVVAQAGTHSSVWPSSTTPWMSPRTVPCEACCFHHVGWLGCQVCFLAVLLFF